MTSSVGDNFGCMYLTIFCQGDTLYDRGAFVTKCTWNWASYQRAGWTHSYANRLRGANKGDHNRTGPYGLHFVSDC